MKKANGANSRSRGLCWAKGEPWFTSNVERIGLFTFLFAISLFVYVIAQLLGLDLN